jgi:hypothetical protein
MLVLCEVIFYILHPVFFCFHRFFLKWTTISLYLNVLLCLPFIATRFFSDYVPWGFFSFLKMCPTLILFRLSMFLF